MSASASPPNGNGISKFDENADLDAANLEPIDKRKMFVGGLSLDTEEDDLRDHFAQYGTVMHCVVKRDPMNGRSRCFGFVTFTNSAAIKKVHEVSSHMIKGRRIDPKPAEPRQSDGSDGIMKVFVGGLDSQMEDDDLKAYFEKFGPVLKVEWPRDRMRNNQKKNFAFIEFGDERHVNDVVRNAKQEIGGRMCDVRKAIPPAQKQQDGGGGGGGRDMGRGMGMGMGGMGGGNMDRNSGWGDFGGGGGGGNSGGFGGGGGFNPFEQYAAAAAYGGFGAEQMAAYYAAQGYDPSAFFTDPTMAAYYGGGGGSGFDMSGAYDYAGGFAAAAAAAGYAGYGGMGGGDGGMRGGNMRGGMGGMGGGMRGSGGNDTSPRGGGFGGAQKSSFGGSSGGSSSGSRGGTGGGTRGYHPYRR